MDFLLLFGVSKYLPFLILIVIIFAPCEFSNSILKCFYFTTRLFAYILWPFGLPLFLIRKPGFGSTGEKRGPFYVFRRAFGFILPHLANLNKVGRFWRLCGKNIPTTRS